MYLALTYDHRLLDGREAVTFLVKVRYNSSHIFELNCPQVNREPAIDVVGLN